MVREVGEGVCPSEKCVRRAKDVVTHHLWETRNRRSSHGLQVPVPGRSVERSVRRVKERSALYLKERKKMLVGKEQRRWKRGPTPPTPGVRDKG